ncbi:hypothetical protein MBLNU230_g3975t1 [Neophaeotheca triangularis]
MAANPPPPTHSDLIIIGAGLYGLSFARTYLSLHPDREILILEASTHIGGVWARDRVYEDFWTQTPKGILEFGDVPMGDVPPEDEVLGFFRAKHVSAYLERCCDGGIGEGGESLRGRVRFGRRVGRVWKGREGAWWVGCVVGQEGEGGQEVFVAPRLVDASGLSSVPSWPAFAGRVGRCREVFHRDFAEYERKLDRGASDAPAEDVVVVGGAKSAADVAYSLCKRGQRVTWLIREAGSGPAAFLPAKGKGGYRNSNESFYTRIVSLFLVSIFSAGTGFPRLGQFLNRTRIGRWLVQAMWKKVDRDAHMTAQYDREDGRPNGFYKLKPDHEIFWQNDSSGINQRSDFFEVIATQCKVIRSDVSVEKTEQSGNGLQLADGTTLHPDTIVYCTGWRDGAQSYFDEEQAASLGLPSLPKTINPKSAAKWQHLESTAEREVLDSYPILDSDWARSQPAFKQANLDNKPTQEGPTNPEVPTSPYRLYKSIVPIPDPSILFLGRVMLGNHFRAAEAQALFACAVLDGHTEDGASGFRLPPKEAMERDVAKTVAWCRRRYLLKGLRGNWFYWDLVPYTDMLLAELGLRSHREGGWWRDLVGTCWARDLRGLVEEYRGRYLAGKGEDGG